MPLHVLSQMALPIEAMSIEHKSNIEICKSKDQCFSYACEILEYTVKLAKSEMQGSEKTVLCRFLSEQVHLFVIVLYSFHTDHEIFLLRKNSVIYRFRLHRFYTAFQIVT